MNLGPPAQSQGGGAYYTGHQPQYNPMGFGPFNNGDSGNGGPQASSYGLRRNDDLHSLLGMLKSADFDVDSSSFSAKPPVAVIMDSTDSKDEIAKGEDSDMESLFDLPGDELELRSIRPNPQPSALSLLRLSISSTTCATRVRQPCH